MIVQITRDQGQFFYSFRYEQMVLPALKLLDIAAPGVERPLFSVMTIAPERSHFAL